MLRTASLQLAVLNTKTCWTFQRGNSLRLKSLGKSPRLEGRATTGNPGLFPDLNIPKLTIRGWLPGDFKPAVGIEPMSQTQAELHDENAKLRRRVGVLQTIMCLLLVLVRVTGCRLDGERLPDGVAKEQVLQAIGKATKILALVSVLKIIGLSKSRYHVENVNETVDEFLLSGVLRRVLAQVEIAESNSLIESWWRGLKHSYSFINSLDNRVAVERLVSFYVQQFNEIMPHRALNWRTPDEVYFGLAEEVPVQLDQARREVDVARQLPQLGIALAWVVESSLLDPIRLKSEFVLSSFIVRSSLPPRAVCPGLLQ